MDLIFKLMISLYENDINEYKNAIAQLIKINQIKQITMNEITLMTKIGEGGQSKVYEGSYGSYHVAIKILHNIDYRSLMNEITILANLIHPTIPKFYGMVNDDKIIALIIQFIKGKNFNLFKMLEIPFNKKITIAKKIASVLEYLHKNGFIHRDIKPENIMIDEGWSVYLLDFGISKICPIEAQSAITITKGTMNYLAPECFEVIEVTDKEDMLTKVTPKVDVWSFGCMLSYMFSDIAPWGAGTEISYIQKSLMEKKAFPIPEIIYNSYPKIYEIIRQCTVINPEEREDMKGINVMLNDIFEDEYE